MPTDPTMPAATEHHASARLSTREGLLRRRRGWFFGMTGDTFIKYVFQGNAAISVVVLALITFTIFREAFDFLPQNRENLQIYRLAGLEFTDLLRAQVQDHAALSRYLTAIRQSQYELLTKRGLAPNAAQAKLADFDGYANRFADSIAEEETLLGSLTELNSSIKERQKVGTDLREAKQNYLRAARTAPPARAAELKKQADAIIIEQVDFAQEIVPVLAQRPDILAANQRLIAALRELSAAAPTPADPALQRRIARFRELVAAYLAAIPVTEQKMAEWNQNEPVTWLQSFHAFLFGREWVTASFWQDWYGILPLFTGSLLIAVLALLIAIPLGVASAIYVNQVASPVEQRLIKPYIEFISAIPSVVLGFFGIAVLGETLRQFSQVSWLAWIPGFPIIERLNASTAACLLALISIPTIFSLAEDAINNVPRAFKEASLALGATRLQTILRIIVPAALSGIMAAILLGLGRVIGETMVVLLCAGNRIQIPNVGAGLGVVFEPVHTMTGIIAQEMGEVVRNTIHYRALFMVGVVLFLLSLLINWLAQKIVHRYRLVQT